MNKTKIFAAASSALFLANFLFPSALMGQSTQYGSQEITADGETITMTAPQTVSLGSAEVNLLDVTQTVAPLPAEGPTHESHELIVEDIRGVVDDGNFTVEAIASIPFTDITNPTNTISADNWLLATTTANSVETVEDAGFVANGAGFETGAIVYKVETTPATGLRDIAAEFDISPNAVPDGSDAGEYPIPVSGLPATLDAARTLINAPATGGRVQRVATAVVQNLNIPAATAVGVYSGRITYTLLP